MSDSLLDMKIIPGTIGAGGVAVGNAYMVDRSNFKIPRIEIAEAIVKAETGRFKVARQASLDQLHDALVKVSRREHRIIIETHMMLTADEMLFSEVQDLIETKRINAEWAVEQVIEEVVKPLNEQDEQYLRERRADIEHVANRLLRNLMGLRPDQRLDRIKEPVIVVAHDISPADMAMMKREYVLGLITDVGGSTGHIAILARGMGIPTLVGAETATSDIRSGDMLILDAFEGRVIVHPPREMVEEFNNKSNLYEAEKIELLKYKDLPTVTRDQKAVTISANVEFVDEIPLMQEYGVRSIGLFRTEFLYLTTTKKPTEEEQFHIYKNVLEKAGPENVVTIRTLDLGADKILPHLHADDKEANPALGSRGIRLSFRRLDLFREQLRALLRASVYGKMRIMFPMISGLGEVSRAKQILQEMREELMHKDIDFDPDIKIGIMMEVPSAALIADVLAKEVDFFSIGTNDLIQYMLAVDRVNEHVNYLYSPLHPAVIRVIDEVVRKGHEAGIKVSMCGEMAGEIHYLMLLIGLGLDELSMSISSVLKIKWFLRNLEYKECRAFAEDILSLGRSSDVQNHLYQQMSCRFPELFPAGYWKQNR